MRQAEIVQLEGEQAFADESWEHRSEAPIGCLGRGTPQIGRIMTKAAGRILCKELRKKVSEELRAGCKRAWRSPKTLGIEHGALRKAYSCPEYVRAPFFVCGETPGQKWKEVPTSPNVP